MSPGSATVPVAGGAPAGPAGAVVLADAVGGAARSVVPGATDAPALSALWTDAVGGGCGARGGGKRTFQSNSTPIASTIARKARRSCPLESAKRVLSTFRSWDGVDPARVPGVTAQHAPRGDSDTAPTVPSQGFLCVLRA
jgi:hypothetical protein